MQYGQITCLLFVAMLLYYAALIILDIQRAKAIQDAENDSYNEEDIDISDEARSFKPTRIDRDEPVKQDNTERENPKETDKDNPDSGGQEHKPETGRPFHRPGYREAIMTDGILVEDLLVEMNRLAETGTCDLGTLIYNCENARL